MNGKVVGLVLLVAGGLMRAIETAGSWIASGSLGQHVPHIPSWRENWLGITFVIVGTLLLISGWREYVANTARNFWNSLFVYDTKEQSHSD